MRREYTQMELRMVGWLPAARSCVLEWRGWGSRPPVKKGGGLICFKSAALPGGGISISGVRAEIKAKSHVEEAVSGQVPITVKVMKELTTDDFMRLAKLLADVVAGDLEVGIESQEKFSFEE